MTGHDDLRTRVRDYYDNKLRTHGATPRGADWNSLDSQELRFRELARVWASEPDAAILDYGCGYGAMAGWLRRQGHAGPYLGYDVSGDMIAAATAANAGLRDVAFATNRATA